MLALAFVVGVLDSTYAGQKRVVPSPSTGGAKVETDASKVTPEKVEPGKEEPKALPEETRVVPKKKKVEIKQPQKPTLFVRCNGEIVTILGTQGKDFINGTPGDDVIHGLGGNDTINGLGGNDVICGGDGDDTLYGRSGNDTLDGGRGNDKLYGGPGNDECINGPSGTGFLVAPKNCERQHVAGVKGTKKESANPKKGSGFVPQNKEKTVAQPQGKEQLEAKLSKASPKTQRKSEDTRTGFVPKESTPSKGKKPSEAKRPRTLSEAGMQGQEKQDLKASTANFESMRNRFLDENKTKQKAAEKELRAELAKVKIKPKVPIKAVVKPSPSIDGPMLFSDFSPGGYVILFGSYFGKQSGSVSAVLQRTRHTFSLVIDEWTDSHISGWWPDNLSGFRGQPALLEVVTADNVKSSQYRIDNFRPALEYIAADYNSGNHIVDRFSDGHCSQNADWNACYIGIEPSFAIHGEHANGSVGPFPTPFDIPNLGTDTGTDRYRFQVLNDWTIESVVVSSTSGGDTWAQLKSEPDLSQSSTEIKVKWSVAFEDRSEYNVIIVIAGPRGIPWDQYHAE
jgi:hypothetical protein